MTHRPEDFIGKWFSNVGGKPEDYYYVIAVDPQTKDEADNDLIAAKYVVLTTRGISSGKAQLKTRLMGRALKPYDLPKDATFKVIRRIFEKTSQLN